MIFFFLSHLKLWLQKAAGHRRLLKSLFPPMKRLMLHLIFGSFILPQTPVALVRCSRGLMDGNQSSEQPQSGIQKPLGQALLLPWSLSPQHHVGLCHGSVSSEVPMDGSRLSFSVCTPCFSQILPRETWEAWPMSCLDPMDCSAQPKSFCKQLSAKSGGSWCLWVWFGWWCLLHALHTDNLDKIPLISWFSLIRNRCNFSCNF